MGVKEENVILEVDMTRTLIRIFENLLNGEIGEDMIHVIEEMTGMIAGNRRGIDVKTLTTPTVEAARHNLEISESRIGAKEDVARPTVHHKMLEFNIRTSSFWSFRTPVESVRNGVFETASPIRIRSTHLKCLLTTPSNY